MLEEIGPIAAAVMIPILWALAAYRCWILPEFRKEGRS